MDIKEKQAIWLKEKPLFEAEFIHSHLLPFFHFNENTGDYEIKTESVNNTDEEDRKVAYESLNTGWVMWLRAKRTAKAQAVPYESCSIKSHEIIINEAKKEFIDGYDIAKEDEYLLESLVYRGVCIGKAQAVPEGFVLVPKLSANYLFNKVPELGFKHKDEEDTVLYHLNYMASEFRDSAKQFTEDDHEKQKAMIEEELRHE